MPGDRLYFEDLEAGRKSWSPVVLVTEEEMVDFARRYDPQPMHTDREAAAHGPFGGLIASGWHTAALMMRMMAEAQTLGGGGDILGLGVDAIRWPVPVRPGDRLQAEIQIESMRVSNSNPAFGIVKLKVTVRNQRGEVVMLASPNCWVPRRG